MRVQDITITHGEGTITLQAFKEDCITLTVKDAELLAQWIYDACDEADPPADRDPAVQRDLDRVRTNG